jgi:frizzled protein 5/8
MTSSGMAPLKIALLALVLLLVCRLSECYRGRSRLKERKCEETTIPLCKQIGYNLTYMPNRFGHKNQFDAGLIIHQFWPLVLINCSPRLKHFVCSLYAPICDPLYHKVILPCRSFCEEVRDSCAPVMLQNGFPWPSHLKCANFPTRQQNRICMKPEKQNRTDTSHTKNRKHFGGNVNRKLVVHNRAAKRRKSKRWRGGCGCLCKAPFVYPNKTRESGEEIPPCALPCRKYFFDENQSNFVTFWLGLWSIIAFVATFITIVTFFLDRSSFVFTERPIIFIASCYLLVSFGYIVRLVYGHAAIACNEQTKLIRYSATGPAQCTAVFILTYFFTNVAWIWWVLLSMNWYLSTGLKWSPEAISNYSQYFHFVAWLIPTVQTMAILAMAAIDGDPVSGLCSVGNHDNNILNIFVIAPLLVYTMLSLTFFAAGCVAICKSKKVLQHPAAVAVSSKKQSKYFSRIGLFTLALFVPALSLIGCYFYEHNSREHWEKSTNCPCIRNKEKPNFYVYLLKYFMSLMTGLVTGVWVLETRTLVTWKHFVKKMYAPRDTRGGGGGENNICFADNYNYTVSL